MFSNAITNIFSLTSAIYGLRRVITGALEDIKELDQAFASIAMVTDYSVSDMWKQYDKYAEMANELGQATKDVIKSSALYYQQGLQTNEALELTRTTMTLATLGEIDFAEATSEVTAA